MLGKIEGRRRKEQQRMRRLDGITDVMDKFEQVLGVDDGQGSSIVAFCCYFGLEIFLLVTWLSCAFQSI